MQYTVPDNRMFSEQMENTLLHRVLELELKVESMDVELRNLRGRTPDNDGVPDTKDDVERQAGFKGKPKC